MPVSVRPYLYLSVRMEQLGSHWTVFMILYIHGSVRRDSILIRSNEMQQYAGVYLLQNYSTCFGVYRTHHQDYIKL